MSRNVALRAEQLRVRRGRGADAFELRVDSLTLRAGEALAVLGPNGAGKSTLLRALAGLCRPDGGRVERVAGGPVTMVFQRPIPFAGSVEHNVHSALRGLSVSQEGEREGEVLREREVSQERDVLRKPGSGGGWRRWPRRRRLSAEARRVRCREALERFGIAELARRRASTLSGGELRRLALARAFARRPAVLLLDEPFDDLDAAGQEALSLDLRRALEDTGVALALVTHELRHALLLADHIAVLRQGRIEQQGPRDAVLGQPGNPAVARLVGMVNLVPGVISRPDYAPEAADDGDHDWVAADAEHGIPVPRRFEPDTPVWVGIRPERLNVDLTRGEGLAMGKAVVRHVVSDASVTTLVLDWAGHSLRASLLAGRGLARSVAPGQVLVLAVQPEDVHLIPRAID